MKASQSTTSMLHSILGREASFLAGEIETATATISTKVESARILVIGAAGSIGGAFVKELVKFPLGGLHLIDISENNLAEFVRDLRSSGTALPDDFRTYAIDFSGPEMVALLRAEQFDYVLNFSALKHVRSERDPFTLMRMLEINVLGNDALIRELVSGGTAKGLFSVSSDKAVRPANLMGASKALMERIGFAENERLPFGSARFANVAFSDGSLLHSFRLRLEKGQPLSAPRDVRRYFISHEEAGQLCLLGCFVCEPGEIVFPKFKPESDMMTFSEIARLVLEQHGLEAVECGSEGEALSMAKAGAGDGRWPCYFSDSDTTGEKLFEEFCDPREEADLERFPTVGVITKPITSGAEELRSTLDQIAAMRQSGSWTKGDLVEVVRTVIPELEHHETHRDLDQKM